MYSTKTETQRCGCRALSSLGYVRNGIPTGCAVSQHHQLHHPATVGCSQRMSMNQTPEHSSRVLTCGRAHTHNSTHCPRPCQAQQRAHVYCNSKLKVTETLPIPTVWSQHGSIPSLSQSTFSSQTPHHTRLSAQGKSWSAQKSHHRSPFSAATSQSLCPHGTCSFLALSSGSMGPHLTTLCQVLRHHSSENLTLYRAKR